MRRVQHGTEMGVWLLERLLSTQLGSRRWKMPAVSTKVSCKTNTKLSPIFDFFVKAKILMDCYQNLKYWVLEYFLKSKGHKGTQTGEIL